MWARLWFGDGGRLDLGYFEDEAAVEAAWRGVARVEWLASPKGRLDHLLPQSLQRQVRNANARSSAKRGPERNVT